MHLGRARVEEHRDELPRRVAADDRVVDDHEPLAGDLGERVELQSDALLAQLLVGLDEGAADVAVLDQPLAVRDPGRAREADRSGRAGVGDRQDEVGLDRRLVGEPLAHPHARACTSTPPSRRVGPREVEELEDAERAAGPPAPPARADAVLVDHDDLARPDSRSVLGADQVERARLGRDAPSRPPSRPSTSGRKPCGSRKREQLAFGERDDRVRALEPAPSPARPLPRSGAGSCAISAAISSVSEVDAEPDAVGRELRAQLGRR